MIRFRVWAVPVAVESCARPANSEELVFALVALVLVFRCLFRVMSLCLTARTTTPSFCASG